MSKKQVVMAGLAGLSGALAGVAAWLIPNSRKKITPAERERRRRLAVNARGRTGSAIIVDYRDGIVCYTYSVGGLEYTAFQDLSALPELLPTDPATLIATPATLKYLAANPANSMLVCEEWSGIRFHPQTTAL
jgi:hypothetical protein